MKQIQGIAIFGGIAIGTISLYGKKEQKVKQKHIEDTKAEIRRYEEAKMQAVSQLEQLYEKAIKEVGESDAEVFEVHKMMLEDDDYNDSIVNIIKSQKVNAEYAVAQTGEIFAKTFLEMEDDYFKERSTDVKDVSEKVIAVLTGEQNEQNHHQEPVIIVAQELTPSETIQMDRQLILAFVTSSGSKNSHSAILARAMNIPAVTKIQSDEEWEGKMGIVDGFTGTLYIDPDEETLTSMKQKQKELKKQQEMLEQLKGKETISKSGKKIHLYANIGRKSDIDQVLSNDAEGIGLFRTEFLYLERNDYPTEEEQFQVYRYAAEKMSDRKVIIRTLDIGADKRADYFNLPHEENPAMGYRAIRICLDHPEMFKTQLRAILRAAAYGRISVMFPMIISVVEVQKAKALLEEAREELLQQGIQPGKVEIGIMIETPAAVMVSDILAKEVDFFSIGTNDLTQYTLAIDRQNQKLDSIYDAHHPAIMEMIRMVIENAHKNGIWAGICGELGADLSLTKAFLEMGIDELSVTPSMVLKVRQEVVSY